MRDILNSLTVRELREEIKKSNITGYTRLKKTALVDLMLKHEDTFTHITKKAKKGDLKEGFKRHRKQTNRKKVKRNPKKPTKDTISHLLVPDINKPTYREGVRIGARKQFEKAQKEALKRKNKNKKPNPALPPPPN